MCAGDEAHNPLAQYEDLGLNGASKGEIGAASNGSGSALALGKDGKPIKRVSARQAQYVSHRMMLRSPPYSLIITTECRQRHVGSQPNGDLRRRLSTGDRPRLRR
jgi:hypothetical protein